MIFKQCAITRKQQDSIEAVLEQELITIGVHTVLLADMAGNIVAKYDGGNCSSYELCSLAVLASANCVAMDAWSEASEKRSFPFTFLTDVTNLGIRSIIMFKLIFISSHLFFITDVTNVSMNIIILSKKQNITFVVMDMSQISKNNLLYVSNSRLKGVIIMV